MDNLRHCAAFANQFYTNADPDREGLRQITCHTLVIVGKHDVFLRKAADLAARYIPCATLKVLDGLGHMIAIEDPERVTGLILDFLKAPMGQPGALPNSV